MLVFHFAYVLGLAIGACAKALPGGTNLSYCNGEGYPTKVQKVIYSDKHDPPRLQIEATIPIPMAEGDFVIDMGVSDGDTSLVEEKGEFCDFVNEHCPFPKGPTKMSFDLSSEMLIFEPQEMHAKFTLFFRGGVAFCFSGYLGLDDTAEKLVLQDIRLEM